MTLKVVVVCALIAVVKCGILDDVKGAASDVGEFFTNKFNDFRSLFPNNESVCFRLLQFLPKLQFSAFILLSPTIATIALFQFLYYRLFFYNNQKIIGISPFDWSI
ncbi:unnamed protein product [Toxocara canis]|uniref:Uncharacterized protein n=1 Tax=Toxocara canis TaxID=6265 RepID=A0A183TZ59_TOXCA|nr:unnamed protein product [Toxocara canis]